MKKSRSWIILTLVFYLIFLLWSLPADLALSFMQKHKVIPSGAFAVSGLEGAWSAGRIVELKAGGLKLNNLSWRFQPLGLLSGRLQFALASDVGAGSTKGVLRVGLDTLELKKLRGRVPAGFLGQIYLPGVELSGVFETDGMSLVAENGHLVEGVGRLVWSNARIDSPYQVGLGGVALELSTDSDGIVFKLNDTGGGLQAGGLGVLSPEGNYSFNGTLGVRQDSAPELATYLQLLGKPEADGMVKIGLNGRLPRLF